MGNFGLTNKELIQLRIKCLEPFVNAAMRQNLERLVYLNQAEKAWEFATKHLQEGVEIYKPETTDSQP